MSEKRKVTVDGEDFEVEISPGEGVWEVSIEGRTYSVEVEGTKRSTKRKKRVAKSTGGSGSGVISSAIPGKIVAIMAAEGDNVEEGGVVIVLEAMKMQNEIKAGIGGRVRKIMCKPGERVEANMPLMEIANTLEGDD